MHHTKAYLLNLLTPAALAHIAANRPTTLPACPVQRGVLAKQAIANAIAATYNKG